MCALTGTLHFPLLDKQEKEYKIKYEEKFIIQST